MQLLYRYVGPLIAGVKYNFFCFRYSDRSCNDSCIYCQSYDYYSLKKVEVLVQTVDSFYDSGLGEEYLSRLVKSNEDNSAQTAALKDALIEDFREIVDKLQNVA